MGAGTGTVAFGWKGGIGTSSRKLPSSLGGYTLSEIPFGMFLLMSTPFRSMDPSLEEAATTAGSSGWQVFRRVTFPLAIPSVLAVLILTFIRSLEAFIEQNGQWERAARELYCHRHTLRYRIRRVEQLTGRDLSNARDRIEFWLALRARELVT